MKKWLLLISWLFLLPLLYWRVSAVTTNSQQSFLPNISQVSAQSPTPGSTGAGKCSIIGNNLAVPFGSGGNYNEAKYTLALLTGHESVSHIAALINGSSSTVIVRLGAGGGALGPQDPNEYANMLRQVSEAVGGKHFVATAGQNEANCSDQEYMPVDDLVNYSKVVGERTGDLNMTLITGQIDHYCGNPARPRPEVYISRLVAEVPNLEGLALPFYITPGTPNAQSTVDYFKNYANSTSLPVYVTESGPYLANSMAEFTKAVPMVLAEVPQIEAFLLFNSQGINPDGNFTYTRPFWNPACREAFRTQCTDPEEVLRICGQAMPQDDYYIYKIDGLDQSTGASPQDRAVGIFHDLVDQGYQAHCSVPTMTMSGERGGDYSRLMELIRDGRALPPGVYDITTTISYNAETAQVPLWRRLPGTEPGPKTSLEDYFGYKPKQGNDAIGEEIAAGVAYWNLEPVAQCTLQVSILETIDKMCQQLTQPTACALYQKLNNSSYTTQTLLPAFKSMNKSCYQVFHDSQNLTADEQTIVKALSEVPLYLDKAYRMAFLVISAEIEQDKRGFNPPEFFNFFTSTNPGTGTSKHEVRVIAFKIPDVATNKERGEIYYDDPISISRNTWQSADYQENRIKAQEDEKIAFKNKPPLGTRVTCPDPICNDPLTKALVDIINRTEDPQVGNSCKVSAESLGSDPSSQIYDYGSLYSENPGETSKTVDGEPKAPFAGQTFKQSLNMVKDLFMNPPEQQENPQRASFDFLSKLDIKIENHGPGADVNAYLVYPMGYELEDVEKTIVAIFSPEEDLEDHKSAVNEKPYFSIDGLDAEVNSQRETYSFGDAGVDCPPPDPETGVVPPCTKRVDISVAAGSNDRAPRILGGRLGHLIRSVEKSLFHEESDFWNFIDSCKTTEEFLTGRCGGRREESRASASNPSTTDTGGTGTCVPVPRGPCSVENLKTYLGGDERKATIASIICNRESRGLSYYADGRPVINNGCTTGQSADYSVGLFQINAMAHCPGAFTSYTLRPPSCSIGSHSKLDACVEKWLIPEENIKKMVELSQNGNNWRPWSAAGACSAAINMIAP